MRRVISLFQTESYSERFPSMKILREEDLFVEVDCYNLLIPVSSMARPDADVDIFADTVLRLVRLGRNYTTEQIADMMCVDPDFIRFIFARLSENGLTDQKGRSTSTGEARFSGTGGEKHNVRLQNAYAFAVRGTLSFLSYIHTAPLVWESVSDDRRNSFTIRIGSAGRSEAVKGTLIRSRNENGPRPRFDVYPRLIRNYNRLCSGMTRYQPVNYQTGYMIEATREPGIILHCKLAVQDGSADNILLSDGFSVNCDELCRWVLAADPEIEKMFLAGAVHTVEQGPKELTEEQAEKTAAPVPERYSEIYRRLRNRRTLAADSLDAAAEAAAYDNQLMRRLYEAVEWALFYFVKQNPPSQQLLDMFGKQSPMDNYRTLTVLADKIGLDCTEYGCLFSQLSGSGMSRCFGKREPTLGILLPLAVASAAEDRKLSFHAALAEMPDLLAFLTSLSSIAAKVRHEAGAERIDPETGRKLDEKACRLIELLLPDIKPDAAEGTKRLDGASQRRINARFSLSQKLGWDLFQRLDPSLQEELLLISPDKPAQELPPPNEFIFILSRILEYSFRDVLQQSQFRSDAGKNEVLSRIQSVYGRTLPEAVRRVMPWYLEAALRGKTATLNGYFIAFLYYYAEKDPAAVLSFWEDGTAELIGIISNLRGHTAEAALSAGLDRLLQYREQVFGVVQKLAEL